MKQQKQKGQGVCRDPGIGVEQEAQTAGILVSEALIGHVGNTSRG